VQVARERLLRRSPAAARRDAAESAVEGLQSVARGPGERRGRGIATSSEEVRGLIEQIAGG
jgi:hypothetical protein